MFEMKNLLYLLIVLFISVANAQDIKKEFVLNEDTDLIEGTYYYENGQISQSGTFNKEGKLHGEWNSFNRNGKQIASAMYENGTKVGKWYFLANNTLKEVNYTNNIVASVSELKNTDMIAQRSN